jgi:pantoate--beta-alanine ligase
MSSRNGYLDHEQRAISPLLYLELCALRDRIKAGARNFSELIVAAKQRLSDAGFNPDYIELRSAQTLMQVGHEDKDLVILAAAFCGKTRLIDNLRFAI